MLVRWRCGPDPLGSRDPGRQGGKEVGRVARARGCGRARVCAGALWVRGHRWTTHVEACLRASVSGVCADACVGVRVWGHAVPGWWCLCLFGCEGRFGCVCGDTPLVCSSIKQLIFMVGTEHRLDIKGEKGFFGNPD